MHGILGWLERRGGTIRVALVAKLEVLEDGLLLVGVDLRRDALGGVSALALDSAAMGASGGISGEEDLHFGGRKDDGADVTTLCHHAPRLADLPLEGDHGLAHLGNGRDGRDGAVHLGRPNDVGDVAPVNGDGLARPVVPERDRAGARHLGSTCRVLGVDAPAEALGRHGSVHGARVEVGEVALLGDRVGDGRLA